MKTNWDFIFWEFLMPLIALVLILAAISAYNITHSPKPLDTFILGPPWAGKAWSPQVNTSTPKSIPIISPKTCYKFINETVCR